MSAPQTLNPIDGVIMQLEQLIDWALHQQSRIGYFASLYLRITTAVRAKIGTGYFEEDARMEVLDTAFAVRYLSAVEQFRADDPALPPAWAVALRATARENLIIVQHLLLAMNAHINIDLAAAAASTCPGASINGFHDDFMKINGILTVAVKRVITEIGELSPFLHLLDDLAETEEIGIIDFSLTAARAASWVCATKVASVSSSERDELMAAENVGVAAFSQKILAPDPIAAEVISIIRSAEVKEVVQIIPTLESGNPVPDRTEAVLAVARTTPEGKAPNRVYYFEVAPGTWTGTFMFELTNWRKLWFSSMSLKNKMLATAMHVFQRIFGASTIASQLTPYPDRGASGIAINEIRIFKSWLTLWRSHEEYTLSPNGTRVRVNAQVNFGPISFLFREHDVYPATVYQGWMRNLYHIKLLGTRFFGKYDVQPDRRQVQSLLINEWSAAHEVLNKSAGPNSQS